MGCSASVKSMYSDLSVDRSHFFFSKVIGAGGFGTVYSAIHTDYHTWFAVKRISKAELLKHKSGLDMLFGELRAWQRVDHHAYIADLHFAFQDR
jgi:serine/threonine protein kinase